MRDRIYTNLLYVINKTDEFYNEMIWYFFIFLLEILYKMLKGKSGVKQKGKPNIKVSELWLNTFSILSEMILVRKWPMAECYFEPCIHKSFRNKTV